MRTSLRLPRNLKKRWKKWARHQEWADSPECARMNAEVGEIMRRHLNVS